MFESYKWRRDIYKLLTEIEVEWQEGKPVVEGKVCPRLGW